MEPTLYFITTHNDKTRDWIAKHVDYPDHDTTEHFSIHWRYLNDIVKGMKEAGLEEGKDFTVEV